MATVVAAPADQQPSLNRDFDHHNRGASVSERFGEPVYLSASGFPVFEAQQDVPVCSNPYDIKSATEAWEAGDLGWLRSIAGCDLLVRGTRGEWTKLAYGFGTEAMEFRLIMPDRSRATLYGPEPGRLPWIATFPISQ